MFCLATVLRSPSKEFYPFYIRSLSPLQAALNALAVAGSNAVEKKLFFLQI